MAIYHASVKIISRSAGRSAVAAAAYRSASEMTDERTGEVHDYARKGGVTHSEIIAPEGAPAWATDRASLWNAVEAAEKRKDSQLAREVEVALPRELSHEQQVDLVRAFVRERFVAHGMVADFSIHNPKAMDGEDQPHAHIMLTMRRLDGAGFGKKATEWNPDFGKKDGQAFVADTSPLMNLREAWAGHVNGALERAGRDERVDHRTLAAQKATAIERGDELAALTLDRRPEPKIGPVAMQMVRQGRADEAYAWQDVQGVRQERQERHQLAGQVIDMARAARELVERQAQRLAALGGRLEAAMRAAKDRISTALGATQEPTQADADKATAAEWQRLMDAHTADLRARAEATLIDTKAKRQDADRHLMRLEKERPSEPRGVAVFIPGSQARHREAMKAWNAEYGRVEKERNAQWTHEDQLLAFLGKEDRGTSATAAVERLYQRATREVAEAHPDLAKRMEGVRARQEAQRQKEIEQRRAESLERFEKQRADRSNSRGRGGRGRG